MSLDSTSKVIVLPVRVLTKLKLILCQWVYESDEKGFVMTEESGRLELRRRLTSALDGESVLVFTMLLIFGIYTTYWLRLAMCCSPFWRFVQFE